MWKPLNATWQPHANLSCNTFLRSNCRDVLGIVSVLSYGQGRLQMFCRGSSGTVILLPCVQALKELLQLRMLADVED